MVLSAHQLHYLPWLRYFHKIAKSDIFVVMDNIQFNKNGWQNRNKIKGPSGWMYLSVPIFQKFQQRIDEVKIDNSQRWRVKHWNALQVNYGQAAHFKEYINFFEEVYRKDWVFLNEINYEMLYFFLDCLGIKTKIVRATQLKAAGTDSLRLLNICKELGADTYLTGAYALGVYLDEKLFQEAGIKLIVQDWHCPQYIQLFPQAGFIPDLSIVDLLFNYGKRSLEIIL